MSEAEPKPVPAGSVFWFTGRISAKRYWAHVAGALLVLVATVVLLAIAMDPRGSSDPAFLVLALFGLFVWMIAAAMTQRLRDAGKPPALALVFMIVLLGSIFLGLALIEVAPIAGPIGFFAILVLAGHIDTLFTIRNPDAA
jgi:uncharacterized membrane protein YhaH (DUF805 family)